MPEQSPQGTMCCPICAWPEPHAHSPEEIAGRPAIDWARLEFERQAREFMLSPLFKVERQGYYWAFAAELARRVEVDPLTGKRDCSGWAAREGAAGPYRHEFVQAMWLLWRMAWLAAKGGGATGGGEGRGEG